MARSSSRLLRPVGPFSVLPTTHYPLQPATYPPTICNLFAEFDSASSHWEVLSIFSESYRFLSRSKIRRPPAGRWCSCSSSSDNRTTEWAASGRWRSRRWCLEGKTIGKKECLISLVASIDRLIISDNLKFYQMSSNDRIVDLHWISVQTSTLNGIVLPIV